MLLPRVLAITLLAWLVYVALLQGVVLPWLRRGPGGPFEGLLWRIARTYGRVWQRVRFSGREKLPRSDDDHDGLVVVSNHTGAVDPLLIQMGCRFLIRWMMAADMMSPALDWLWRDEYVIPVARDGRDSGPLREAIRHVRGGGAVGVFPEGRITIPPREIRPFLPGVGLIVARSRAPVLLAWVSGTPDTNKMGEAFRRRGHARVVYLDVVDYAGERDPAVITEDLRRRLAAASGWPLNDEVLAPGGGRQNGTGKETREAGAPPAREAC